MSPRPSNKAERQNQILDAAMEVFTHLGFHKARMDDIAGKAGLSKGSLYWHFKSKDDVIAAVLMRMFQGYLGDLKKVEDAPGPAAASLLRYFRQSVNDINKLQRWQPLMAEFYAISTRHRSTRLFMQRFYQEYIDILAGIIARGMEEGDFTSGDAHQQAFLLVSAGEGVILMCSLGLCNEKWGDQFASSLLKIVDSLLVQNRERKAVKKISDSSSFPS